MKAKSNADSKYIWMEGKLVPYAEANVHILTHSFHYGAAPFEGLRAYATSDGSTAMFRAVEHYQRFLNSIRVMGYHTPYALPELIEASRECIKANGFKECYVRPIAYVDDSVRGLTLPEFSQCLTAICMWDWGKYLGEEGQRHGIRIMISNYRRADVASCLHGAKLTGNYITSVLARRDAAQHGFDEALLLDAQGFVAEGSGENIFVVKGGVISTPPVGAILPGITRDSVIRLGKDAGYTVYERPLTRSELYFADEIFFAGTAVEITPIREIDFHRIGDGKPGPITRQLTNQFFKCTRGEVPKYREWLTQV